MATTRNSRTKRTPFGVQRRKMTLDRTTSAKLKSTEKRPRWINDVDNRIYDAEQGGYEFVNERNVKVGEAEDLQERRIKKLVGRNKDGSPMNAYLMAIPEKYYKEDQIAKEEQNQLVDEAIRGGSPAGLKNHGVSPGQGSVSVKNVDYKP